MQTGTPALDLSDSQHKPSISACLIVKNEAPCLARCLDSLQGVVDEIILVDTGSTDTTLEIAQRYTDKIYHYAWNDHFAQARNFGLQYATQDWILVIDADEVLPAETATLLPDFLKTCQSQPALQVVNLRISSTHHPDFYKRALLRNGQGIHFMGRVHEILALNGQPLPSLNIPSLVLHHTPKQSPVKHAYYQTLLRQNLQEAEPILEHHLLKHLGLNYLACEAWQNAWESLLACYHSSRFRFDPRMDSMAKFCEVL